MPPKLENIDLIIQYALLVAGEEDEFSERLLGPIHLIKYVYLADLSYARRNDGETFTGVDWRFYKFGPWSSQVHSRIEPALLAIQAMKYEYQSDFEERDDWFRWGLRQSDLYNQKQGRLPPEITSNLKRDIHKFGKNTPLLLDYVYMTVPMLSAAPEESLDFSLMKKEFASVKNEVKLRMDGVSTKRHKVFQSRMAVVRDVFSKSRLVERKYISPVSNARYDAVYYNGIEWLESLAGDALTQKKITVEFSTDVWKSNARKGSDVS